MADKILKNRTILNNAIDNEIHARLKSYAEKSSVPISRILDKALKMYLDTVDPIDPPK